ncbi:MAG: hypothetical protein F4Z86_14135 [Gemmatimonadetes bacterium]|nr:hypothetical protein [Gemmatimonadota bacterium]MYB58751.1 hypothetical protein [Gemmatimonadota bacterium]
MDNEIRIHYASHFLKLSLWYARFLMGREGIAFEDAITSRVNVYRNTDFFDGEHHPARGYEDSDWDAYLMGLKAIFDRCEGEAWEEEGLAYLWPRVKKGYSRPSTKGRPYECWTYDDGDDYIAIHIGNVYQPKSPLSEMRDAFMGTLLQLLKDTQQRRSDVKTVRCGSWLNSAPPFQDLFPKSWRKSAIVSPKAGYTMGHWGQFMDRTGRFHIKNGAHLRATGEFLYPCSTCYAPIDEIVAHLEAMVEG